MMANYEENIDSKKPPYPFKMEKKIYTVTLMSEQQITNRITSMSLFCEIHFWNGEFECSNVHLNIHNQGGPWHIFQFNPNHNFDKIPKYIS